MSKGTASQGKKSGSKLHIACRRCGSKSYHMKRKECSSCGYGKSSKMRSYAWQK
jgi:large subunit ribosomal protein L37e